MIEACIIPAIPRLIWWRNEISVSGSITTQHRQAIPDDVDLLDEHGNKLQVQLPLELGVHTGAGTRSLTC